MHNHNDCKHDLKICAHCDVAYCTKCNKEWGNHQHVNIVPIPYQVPFYPRPYFQPYQPYWLGSPIAGGNGLSGVIYNGTSVGGGGINTVSLS